MVEGPGCKVKGEVMSKKIVGKVVTNVQVPSNKKLGRDSSQLLTLCGLKVLDVCTLGKELFIFFEQSSVCLRIHFLMDGSVRYGKSKDERAQAEPSLKISFADEHVSVFKSSVDMRSAEETSQYCKLFTELDICSPAFNFKRAQEKIGRKQNELICDVIMDQAILPGVGNIIKNEGLFKSGINPNRLVKDLSPNLITCLLHRLRDFSSLFYKCRKNNKPLKPHLCIYEKSLCTQCGKQITTCKPGSLGRLTFFCSSCQTNSSSTSTISLPKKNLLLGFLKLSTEPSLETNWECTWCTYVNSSPTLVCAMCFSAIKDNKKRKLSSNDADLGAPVKKKRSDITFVNNNGDETTPVCPSHQKTCVIRTVIHSGENKGRIFYCCSMRGDKQCKFFQWADLHHPVCKHDKRAIKRRVLKQNDNNGKEFYCCPLSKTHLIEQKNLVVDNGITYTKHRHCLKKDKTALPEEACTWYNSSEVQLAAFHDDLIPAMVKTGSKIADLPMDFINRDTPSSALTKY